METIVLRRAYLSHAHFNIKMDWVSAYVNRDSCFPKRVYCFKCDYLAN